MIAALFVETGGAYFNLEGVDPWDKERDARKYDGPHPVVAHPPCHLWVNLAAVNWPRYKRQRPAWYPGGDDGGCFASALASVRKWGGVLEHPQASSLWPTYGLPRPGAGFDSFGGWSLDVDQFWWGHKARKRTWLYIVGCSPRDIPPLPIVLGDASHVVSWALKTPKHRRRPLVPKRERELTPPAFAAWLVDLAGRCSRVDV